MTAEPRSETAEERSGRPARSSRRVALILLGLVILFLSLHTAMDRFTPYTSQAELRAPVIAVAPSVSGEIVEVGVRDNQLVRAGDLIFEIDPTPFAAAERQAEAELQNVIQQLGAGDLGLGGAEAASVEAQARLPDVQAQNLRAEQLFERGYVAQAAVDKSRADLAAARSAVRSAEARLDEARQRLGPRGEENPQVRAALAARERAQIDLAHARVVASVDGAVTNTVLSVGQFAAAGQRVATIVDTARAWIVAQLPENELGRIRPGDPVDIVLDVLPGRVFHGEVESIAWGVEQTVAAGTPGAVLARPVERDVWLRASQRIPVRIDFVALDAAVPIRAGGLANVMIYTEAAGFLAPIARAWLRAVAYARFIF